MVFILIDPFANIFLFFATLLKQFYLSFESFLSCIALNVLCIFHIVHSVHTASFASSSAVLPEASSLFPVPI